MLFEIINFYGDFFENVFLLVPAKSFFADEKIRLNPVAEVQPFSLPLFLLQNTSNDEQRYTFYRTADVLSAD